MIIELSRIYNKYFLLLSLILVAILGFYDLGDKNYFMDEIASILISRNFGSMVHMLNTSEGNMWLYQIILHFWLVFGESEFAVRTLSIIFTIATIPFVYLIGKNLFTRKVAQISTLLIASNLFFIFEAQNARSYSMFLFFTSVSFYFFIKYLERPKKIYLLFFTLLNILGIYSHLYAVFTVATQFLLLIFLNKKIQWKTILFSSLITFLASLPLFLSPAMHSNQIYWIPKPGIKQLIGTYLVLADDFIPFAAVIALLFGAYVFALWKSKKLTQTLKDRGHTILLSWLLLPIIASFLISIIFKPMYTSTYFISCVIPFSYLIAISINNIKRKALQNIVIALLILLSAIRLFGWYTEDNRLTLVIGNHNEDWVGVSEFLSKNETPYSAVIFFPPYWQEYVNFYYDKLPGISKINMLNLQPNNWVGGSRTTPFNKEMLLSMPQNYTTIWYLRGEYTTLPGDNREVLINKMLNDNYILKQTFTFHRLKLYQYMKPNPYASKTNILDLQISN